MTSIAESLRYTAVQAAWNILYTIYGERHGLVLGDSRSQLPHAIGLWPFSSGRRCDLVREGMGGTR